MIYLLLLWVHVMLVVTPIVHLMALGHIGLRWHRRGTRSRGCAVEWRAWCTSLLEVWRHVARRLILRVAEVGTRRAHELLVLSVSATAAATLRLKVTVHVGVHALVAELALHRLRRWSALVLLRNLTAHLS